MDNDSITLERARREQLVMQTVNELRDDALIDVEKKRNRCTQIRCGIAKKQSKMNKEIAKIQHGLTMLGATQAGADEFFYMVNKNPKAMVMLVNAACSARTANMGIAASNVHLRAAEIREGLSRTNERGH